MHHIYCDQMKQINSTPSNRTILIELLDDHIVDMRVEEEVVWRRWMKHIGLLLTIPHYPIPMEPSIGLPAEFDTDIPARNCDLHGGWYGACDGTLNVQVVDCVCSFLRSDGLGRRRCSGWDRREGGPEQCTLRRCRYK